MLFTLFNSKFFFSQTFVLALFPMAVASCITALVHGEIHIRRESKRADCTRLLWENIRLLLNYDTVSLSRSR